MSLKSYLYVVQYKWHVVGICDGLKGRDGRDGRDGVDSVAFPTPKPLKKNALD